MARCYWQTSARRAAGAILVCMVLVLLGAGDDTISRYNTLGHKLMCTCGCKQILLECNHRWFGGVGCVTRDGMRGELRAALQKGDNDDVILHSFVQKYGVAVLATSSSSRRFNRFAIIVTCVVLTGALLLLAVFMVRKARRSLVPSSAAPSLDSAELEHIREKVRKQTEGIDL